MRIKSIGHPQCKRSAAQWLSDCILLGSLLLCGCTLLPYGSKAEQQAFEARVSQAIELAQHSSSALEIAESLERLEALAAESTETGVGSSVNLLLAIAWLHNKDAEWKSQGARADALEQSRSRYVTALRSLSEGPAPNVRKINHVRTTLALVMSRQGDIAGALAEIDKIDPLSDSALLVRGDILAACGRSEEALSAYEAAHSLQFSPGLPVAERNEVAATRIALLLGALLNQAGEQRATLAGKIRQFELEGFIQAASLGCEALILDCHPGYAEDALTDWVQLEARRSTFSRAAVARLRRGNSCGRLEEPLDGLTRLLTLADITEDAEGAFLHAVVAQPFWLGDGGAVGLQRRHSFACALQAIARGHALEGRVAIAADILEASIYGVVGADETLLFAPVPRGTYYDVGGELVGSVDIGLDMALDLALYLYGARDEIDQDEVIESTQEVISRPRLRRLLFNDETLSRFTARGAVNVPRSPEQIQSIHSILAVVYAGWHEVGWQGPAEYHFRRAFETAVDLKNTLRSAPEGLAEKSGSVSAALPFDLIWSIGRGLSQGQGLEAFAVAAKGYIDDNDDLRTARAVYRDALAASRRSEKDLLELERLVYPRDRFYLGGSFGFTRVDSSAGQLIDDLHEIDPSFDVLADLNTNAQGWKAYLGKRFNDQIEAELGYVSLGGPESFVVERGVPPNMTLPDAVRSVHPRTADGIALSGIWTPIHWHRITAGARLGAWYWDSELSVDLQTTAGIVNIKDSSDGIDLLFGVKLDYQFDARFGLRAEYEFYGVDSDYVSFLSFGLSYLL